MPGGIVIGGVYVAYATIAYYAVVAASLIYSLTNRPSTPDFSSADTSAGDQGQQANTSIISAPLPLIYGTTRVGINRVYVGTSGTDNKYLHVVYNIGEGEIDSIVQVNGVDQIFLNDKLYNTYGDNVYYEFFNGTTTQIASAVLHTAIPEWNERKKRTAYLYIRYLYDRDVFQSIPDVTVLVKGLKIYNPDTEVTEYSNNPALCALDFLTRSSRRGGMGFDIDRIDLDSVNDAAAYCDTKGWTCNLYLNNNQSASDNFLHILATFRGALVYNGSTFKLKYKDLNYESVVMNFTEDDVVEQGASTLRIRQPSIFNTPNAVNCSYPNSENNYQFDNYILVDNVAIAAAGDYREEAIALNGITNLTNVQKMANYFLEKANLNKNASFVTGSRAIPIEPMDLVTLTHSRPGWDTKILRVGSPAIFADGTVSLDLEEEFESMYDDTYNLQDHVWKDTTLPDPGATVPSVINVSHTEEVYYYRDRSFTRWKIDFDRPLTSDYPWWDYADIYIKIGDGDWKFMTKSDGDYQVDPVHEGVIYYCKMVSVSIFGSKQAFADGYEVSKTILGKTDLPSNMTPIIALAHGDNVSVYGTALTDPDISIYELGLGDAWEGGLFIGSNETPNFRLSGVRPGTHTFWMAAKDNGGNYSETPASAIVTVFYPANYVDKHTWTWDFDGIGTFDNAEHEIYVEIDSLKCSHKTEWMPNQVDRDFSGASAWEDHDLVSNGGTYDASGDLSISSLVINADCFLPVASAPTTIGHTYRLTVSVANLVSTWKICDFTGTQILATITTNGVAQTFDFVAETEGGYRIFALATDSSGDFDDFSLFRLSPSNLVGTWLSPEYDMGSLKTVRVWGDFITVFESSTGTWDALFPTTTLWSDKLATTTKWYELLSPEYAGILQVKLLWGSVTGELTSYGDKLEILAPEISARYLQIEVTITDPDNESFLHLNEINMVAAYWS